jgi:hypothetical protein
MQKLKKLFNNTKHLAHTKCLKGFPLQDKLPVRGLPRKKLKSDAGKESPLPAPRGRRAVFEEDSTEKESTGGRLVEDTNSGVEKVC